MRARFIRTCSTIIGLLLVVAVPTQAGPIRFGDVINVIGDLQNGGQQQQLRLRAALQDPTTGTQTPSRPSGSTVTPAIVIDPVLVGNLGSGIEVTAQQPQSNVQVFTEDSVDGTICDCGEIPAGGGFPWWPFLALIPLVCVTGLCTHHHHVTPLPSPSTPVCVNCFSSPTPPPPVPEPASLLLFGSGIVTLTAAARRRHKKNRAARNAESTREAE
jgi:PEP-CTERM motif